MFCAKCGKDVPDGAKFCAGCGTVVALPRKGVGLAAIATVGLTGFFALMSALYVISVAEGPVKALMQLIVSVPLTVFIIYGICQVIHRVVKGYWIDFRGRTGRFLR